MPYAGVNGARIYYRRYGKRGDAAPILLIHGATVDGITDWGAIAPALGLMHDVIVPDCRGHGRSNNPAGGYTFRQLADDAAALIGALGFERAHVVGHSNGGNVALVTVVEHPEVVATCVIQAANAYVSDDLREQEPALFEPDRVARDSPAWRDLMIRLHAPWHGDDYWRELLAMTVAEIISEPNYRAEDLGRVESPALVIEGGDDRVNALSGHGAFIARGIPDAELWRPAGVGHSVHEERPADWLAHVEDFWRRRGSDLGDRLWRLGQTADFDPRTAVLEYVANSEAKTGVEITVATQAAATRLRAVLGQTAPEPKMRVLEDEAETARVGIGVVDVLEGPGTSSARLSQVLFGERVTVLERRDRFARVRLDHDGYIGWVRASALEKGPAATLTHRVWADQAIARHEPGGEVAAHLPFGALVAGLTDRAGWLGVRAGEGLWWVERHDLVALEGPVPLQAALARFRGFAGVPYLWGGRTAWGFDCSGLVQALYAAVGISLPRDTDQQLAAGAPTEGEPQAGDLLFFGDPTSDDPGRVAHVAIQLDAPHEFLHAWGASASVTVSGRRSDDRAAVLFGAFLGARRYGLARHVRV